MKDSWIGQVGIRGQRHCVLVTKNSEFFAKKTRNVAPYG